MSAADARVRVIGAPLIDVGRWFFGVALLGLGAEHFVFGQFVTGRAPAWPSGVPGELPLVYGAGVAVMLVGAAVLARRGGRVAALLFGVLVSMWALLRLLPVAAADAVLGGNWTSTGKALTFVGGALAVAATLPPVPGSSTSAWRRFANTTDAFVRVGRCCLGAFLILAGMQHFKYLAFVATLIPSWFPGNAMLWSQLAGVALFTFGIGLLFARTAAVAALLTGLMIFSWFWIVHLPRVRTSVSDGIALFESLAFAGIALVIAGALFERGRASVLTGMKRVPMPTPHQAGRSG